MRGNRILQDLLSRSEYSQFIDNARNQDRLDIVDRYMWEEYEPGMYGSIIANTIHWSGTPEGFDYWLDICVRLNLQHIKPDKLSPIKYIRECVFTDEVIGWYDNLTF